MDQELKQRLIGAAVITALAAIFVPMLFDDPIDETGKTINELKIPEVPAKTQDVEFMPLPDKPEAVAETAPAGEPPVGEVPAPRAVAEEGEGEAALEAPKPQLKLGARETLPLPKKAAPAPTRAPTPVVGDDEEPVVAEAEDVPPPRPTKLPAPTAAPAVQPLAQVAPSAIAKPKPTKLPETKPETVVAPVTAPAVKAPVGGEESNRWYLQVGTFSQKPNAAALQESLKQQGFAASVKEFSSDKGSVFKVRIGPIVDKAKAQAIKAKLAQINVNSFVSPDE
ncbi:SPOR domain-containing protein [Methylomonas sp. UP202]|uniref:SPOR domain-containing protein n=1 Tax=Methylomonas sp. UP202 TaxID=3040943 RepID=UPI002479BF9D|nr:SPOR domain-containing protein [Methylomonas sp. UP202]WGS87399.1 SPOR domain-containing protein [Methylomonas sp. UP202]